MGWAGSGSPPLAADVLGPLRAGAACSMALCACTGLLQSCCCHATHARGCSHSHPCMLGASDARCRRQCSYPGHMCRHCLKVGT
ncbi:hypothetical protein GDO81_028975 [Engystomops pustulosus]|uniref:Secreted protein n=1 Tax=Engystomops pustulosus TaxID=76066 RepID=A0AAV6YD65_ENGPU|nr:hypothetical protein GDO81_028975 [Engystomops pustulosus]